MLSNWVERTWQTLGLWFCVARFCMGQSHLGSLSATLAQERWHARLDGIGGGREVASIHGRGRLGVAAAPRVRGGGSAHDLMQRLVLPQAESPRVFRTFESFHREAALTRSLPRLATAVASQPLGNHVV